MQQLLGTYIFLLFLFFVPLVIQAQEPVSVQLSEENGLPDNEFYSVIEDQNGFIWLCANKGLFRYDGKNFKHYSTTKQRGSSVFNVYEDGKGRIWCNTISGQFFYVENDKLQLFKDLNKELKGELAEFIVTDEFLWVFSITTIYKVDIAKKQIVHTYTTKKRYGIPLQIEGTIYIGNTDTILTIDNKNTLTPWLETKLPFEDKNRRIIVTSKSAFFKIGTSVFYRQNWFGRHDFFRWDTTKKSFIKIEGVEAIGKKRIYATFENGNEIWLATNSGVWIYEFKASRFQLKKRLLNEQRVSKIIKDKDENYWFTTLSNGIYIVPNINIEIGNLPEKEKNIKSLDKVNDSILVFGNSRGNIGFYNTKTHTSKIITLPTTDRVSAIQYHPKKNTVFISKDLNGYALHYETLAVDEIKRFEAIKSFSILNNNDLLSTDYRKVNLFKNASIQGDKILISKNKRTFTSFYDETSAEVYVGFVDDLVVYDSLWNKRKIRYKNTPIYAKSITKTSNDMIWVGTFKNGVLGIKNNQVVYHYTTTNGLTSNSIEKVKADQNKLWIATANSIQELGIHTNKLRTLAKRDGVVSYNISGIQVVNNRVFFSSNKGLFSIDKEKTFKTQHPEVYFNLLEINEKDTVITSDYTLKYNQNAIKIGFNVNGFLFNQKGRYKYRLKGYNNDWLTTAVGENSIKYNSLPAGKYTFQVQPFLNDSVDKSKIKELHFLIKTPFWKTIWFFLVIGGLILGSTILYFRNKIKNKEKERVAQLEKMSLEKELIAINLTALRSQMNPHFIFNALNSIQDLVLQQDTDASYDYIVLFAKLIRNTLNYTTQDFISIEKELEFLNVYLQLEKLRFGNEFTYTISYNSKEDVEVPSLLIQPFIENALVHGLLHKEGKKELHIVFDHIGNSLQCNIIDNGIGREKSREINKRQGNRHESFALSAIEKRLEIFKKQYHENIGYTIEDVYKNDLNKGTKVSITIPYKERC